jgi:uncharacterized membrane-anchored protein YjiN (DUF445 family)
MELWILTALTVAVVGTLGSIASDIRSISERIQECNKTITELPEEIAKSIGSNLIYDSDLPERIAKSIGSNLIYDSDLPEKIAKSISHEMLMESNLETKISRAIQSQIGYWDIGTDRPSNLMEHLQSIEKKL